MKSESLKIENPTLFIIVLISFMLSVSLLLYGIFKPKLQNDEDNLKDIETDKDIVTENGKPISEYFKDIPLDSGSVNADEYYLQQDPFREKCAASGNKKPSVVSGTVCYY